jgi:hypothetical protein
MKQLKENILPDSRINICLQDFYQLNKDFFLN